MNTEQRDVCRMKLEFVKPVTISGKDVVEFSKDELALFDVKKCENSLVGYVLGDDPKCSSMKKFVDDNWQQYGNVELYSLESGVFIFCFENSECKQLVLSVCPWFFEVRPIILKSWTPYLKLEKEDVLRVPVWIKLPNLNFHLWSPNKLSRIASLVGKPLFADKSIATSERVSSLRICVEVDAIAKPRSSVPLLEEEGCLVYLLNVEYEWLPLHCSDCKMFLHSDKCNHRCSGNVIFLCDYQV